jgi:hypothetical protein
MPAPITAPALVADFARRGFTLRAVAGRLSVSPATALTTTDRETIRERRNELLSVLSPGEPWDLVTAVRLMHEADTLVVQLGVSGRHPAVVAASAMVTSAFATHDLETVRFAVSEFAVLIRRLARERVHTDETGQKRANPGERMLAFVRQ